MNMLKKLKTNFVSFLSDHEVKKIGTWLVVVFDIASFDSPEHSEHFLPEISQHLYLCLSNCRTPLEVSGATIRYLAQRYLDRRTQGSMRQPSNCGLPTLLSESQLPTKQINACVLFSSTGFLFNPLRLKFSFSC